MRKVLLALSLFLFAPLLIAQCETGPTGGTNGACGGGGGGGDGWYPETIQWGQSPYVSVVSAYDVGKGYTYSYGNGYSMLDRDGYFEVDGVGIYPASNHELYLFIDGQYQLTLDMNNVATLYAAQEVILSSPKCAAGCKFRRITEDLWWALKTGASDACNKATGTIGFTMLGIVYGVAEPNPVLVVPLYVGFLQAFEDWRKACVM